MFAYGDLVQWFKDRCSDQVSRRNKAWDFGREHGLEPCEVAWNNVAVRWIDGVVYESIGDAFAAFFKAEAAARRRVGV